MTEIPPPKTDKKDNESYNPLTEEQKADLKFIDQDFNEDEYDIIEEVEF